MWVVVIRTCLPRRNVATEDLDELDPRDLACMLKRQVSDLHVYKFLAKKRGSATAQYSDTSS